VTTYVFEYQTGWGTRILPVRAVDCRDAFDQFRASHPTAVICDVQIADEVRVAGYDEEIPAP
jgi:hypothetical protein